MTTDRPADYLASLVRELCALPDETEWVEFKVNESEPLREALEAGLIRLVSEDVADKLRAYVPYLA